MPSVPSPNSAELIAVDSGTGPSALRKASWRLIPLIGIAYGVAYTDRVNISFAALQMNRDLHFSASIYGFGAGLFFLSYAACEIPSNLLLVRFGASRWIARIMLTWGLLAMGMIFVKTPLQFYVMRFLLGMAEAGFFPGVVFYLSQWFPANVRARTISQFYVSLPLSSVFMGSVAGALLNLQGHLGLAGWQWLFLVEGFPAVILSVIFFFFLPNTPEHASWLIPAEREWLKKQLLADNAAAGGTHSSGDVLHAILNPRVWQLGLFLLCLYIEYYAFTFSAPTMVQRATGFSNSSVGFVIAAWGLLGGLAMVVNGLHSDRANERFLHLIVPCLLMAGAYVAAGLSVNPLIVISAFTIIFAAFNATGGVAWAIPSTFLTGKSAAGGIATANTIAIIGGFVGPYWMGVAKDLTGDYQRGLLTLSIPTFTAAAILWYMRSRVGSSREIES
jgi:ACS family tartrate transporter-like MFS transporter